jgi:hypothetical protein
MPTKDRKDKFARHKALIEKQKVRADIHIYNNNENAKQVYNNTDFSVPFTHKRRYPENEIYLYKSDYKRFVKKYVNRYVHLKEKKGYGIILGYSDSIYGSIEDEDYNNNKRETVEDKYLYMECNIYDIFNPEIEYEDINLSKINDYLLDQEETNKINKFIKEYYNNNNKSIPSTIKEYENDNCPICLDDYESNKNKYITQCGHSFHSNCLKKWNNTCLNKWNCPLCNQEALNKEQSFNNIYKI